jgi:hypothetical protein
MDVDIYNGILYDMNMKYDEWHDINEFLLNTILVLSGFYFIINNYLLLSIANHYYF